MGRSKPWTHIKSKKAPGRAFLSSVARKTSAKVAREVSTSPFRALLQQKGSGTGGGERVNLRDNDVVLGRGPSICSFKGNLQYRSFVCKYKHLYWTAKKLEKQLYIGKVVDAVRSLKPPGRFLEMVGDELTLVDCEARIYEKVSQALRDKKNCDPRSLPIGLGDAIKLKRFGDELKAKTPNFFRRANQGITKKAAGEAAKSTDKQNQPSPSSMSRSVRGRQADWPPPLTEKEAEKKRKKTGNKKDTTVFKQAKTGSKEEDKTLRIKIRCAGWTAVYGSEVEPNMEDLDEDDSIEGPCPKESETESDDDEASCLSADEIMNDDSIWAGPGMFELLRFPTEEATDGAAKNDFLNLEAAEIVPANDPPLFSSPVLIETDSLVDTVLLGQDISEKEATEATDKHKKPIDRLLSEWAEGASPGALEEVDNAGLSQVFSSEFEAEVASMVSNGEGFEATKAATKDNKAAVPDGIAFMCASSSMFLSVRESKTDLAKDLPDPQAFKALLDGCNNKNHGLKLSLIDITFTDRAEAIDAAKKLLATM